MITRYTSEAAQQQKYLSLLQKTYSHLPSFALSFTDITALLSPEHPTQAHQDRVSVAIEQDGAFLAHCMVMRDEREQPGIGWFGFFECPDDDAVFAALWKGVLDEARTMGLKTLRGPINGSIWYPYRFALPDIVPVPPFHGELFCQDFYHRFFTAIPQAAGQQYYSALRDDFTDLLRITEPFYSGLIADGSLQLEEHDAVTPAILRDIFTLSRTVFQSSWGYVPLTDQELFAYYTEDMLRATLFKAYTLRHGNQLVGFATAFRENAETLILKTLALDPAFQGKGLGNALIHRVHLDAKDHCSRMIYALIRYENNVKRLPKDGAVIFRDYCAWEIAL